MKSFTETIVAPITGLQSAAVAVIRLSGEDSWRIASQVFHGWKEPVQPRYALYGTFAHGDDGLLIPFAKGASYTDEESVEMSIHGSRASVDALIALCLRSGARMAEPGEFTLRAFMNGRMGLTQAEAVRHTVEAQSELELRHANALRAGHLENKVRAISKLLVGELAKIEASVDFSEEIGEYDSSNGVIILEKVLGEIKNLLNEADASQKINSGMTVAIVGRPNAGKSSLMNAILKTDRSIVTEIAGTTRDTVEAQCSIHGIRVTLIDTAGLRLTDDPIESIGVSKTRDAIKNSDFIWYVYDAAAGWSKEDDTEFAALPNSTTCIANKCDLNAVVSRGIAVSALTGANLSDLLEPFSTAAKHAPSVFFNQRHSHELELVFTSVSNLQEAMAMHLPSDLLCTHLRTAIHHLGLITGESASVDLLEVIFSQFCIGK